jgi:hypothetical protein
MAKFTTLSQEVFDQRAEKAKAVNPFRKEVSLKEIEIQDSNTMLVSGVKIPMNTEAFKSVCKIVGLPVGFDKTFTASFGDKARQQLVNRLKLALQAKGSTTISLVVNPNSKEIIGANKDAHSTVSNQLFIDTAGRVIDKYGLDVLDFSISKDGGVVINTASPKNVWGFNGLKDEDHYGGISFTNSVNGGFKVSPYLHRLACYNGIVGTAFDESFTMEQLDAFSMELFWNSLDKLAQRGFRPEAFEDKLRMAINTPASLFEMETAHKLLKSHSDADYKELESWIPFEGTRTRFHTAGIDTLTLTNAQKKGAKTGTSVWDVVNGVTHFATHDNGFKIDDYDRRRIQVQASAMMTKNFDMANIIPSPF